MKKLYIFLFSLIFVKSLAQITAIPDANFEQFLIDLGIDSDGVVNGQVLTSDVENVTDLDISFQDLIQDITGIEAFLSLENLDVSMTPLSGVLDLSANINLISLIANGGGDNFVLMIEKIILNNNPNLEEIIAPEVWTLEQIDLKTGEEDVSDLTINIWIYTDFSMPISEAPSNENICIQVTDANAAQNGGGVYSNWQIITNSNTEFNNFFFSETCTLSVHQFESIAVELYPNPTQNHFNIKTSQVIEKIRIYDVSGKLVYSENGKQSALKIATEAWQKGLYFVNLSFENGQRHVEKLLVR